MPCPFCIADLMVEGVKVHLTVEALLQLVKAFAVLRQQPHTFGHYGLDGHIVGFQKAGFD